MKTKILGLVVSIALTLTGFVAFAQSTVDWEMTCVSGNVELDLLDSGSVLVRCLLGEVVPTPTATTPPPLGGGIVVDHASVALFDQIPSEYLQAARELPMMFSDRSVGENISSALNCLASPSWVESPSYCRVDYIDATQTTRKTFNAIDYTNGVVPELILFPANNVTYNRSNWSYANCYGDWGYMVGYFVNTLAPQYLASKDVLSCQFSYINVMSGSKIMNYFTNTSGFDVYDLEAFITQHPDKDFVFWTTSLATTVGTTEATQFNEAMRAYALENDKILFDMADIISHDRNGNECLTNGYPVICRDYTTELQGGHLGSVSGGQIVMAKAFWVLMAQIAGWTP